MIRTGPFFHRPRPLGAAEFKPQDFSKDAEQAARTQRGVQTAGTAVLTAAAAAAAIPAYPWSLIASAAIATVGVALKVAGAIGARNQKILQGDESTIAGFMRRCAKWKSAHRERVAKRLLKEYEHHKKHKKHGKPWKVRENLLSMKLAALYAVEANAKARPNKPLMGAPPPVEVEQGPDLYDNDLDAGPDRRWLILGGGVAVAVLIVVVSRRRAA